MNKADRITKSERHRRILAKGQDATAVRVSDLADLFGVSTETVRRDLSELCEAGKLKRIYGGATAASGALMSPRDSMDKLVTPEVEQVARAAAQRVRPGQTVKLSDGVIAYEIARLLARTSVNLMVITNSARIAGAAGQNPTIRAVLSPGNYVSRDDCVCGEDSIEYLQQFSADVAIIEAKALTREGPAEDTSAAAAVKRAILHNAMTRIVVVQRDAWAERAVRRICDLGALNEIVTSSMSDPAALEYGRRAGIRISVAEIE
jgi:DeoR/GlpR family transcriptional regulator of sugar metabolism